MLKPYSAHILPGIFVAVGVVLSIHALLIIFEYKRLEFEEIVLLMVGLSFSVVGADGLREADSSRPKPPSRL